MKCIVASPGAGIVSIHLLLTIYCRMYVFRKDEWLKILVRVSVDAVIASVLSGVVVVGGEGLDLGDGEVGGAGGGDGR